MSSRDKNRAQASQMRAAYSSHQASQDGNSSGDSDGGGSNSISDSTSDCDVCYTGDVIIDIRKPWGTEIGVFEIQASILASPVVLSFFFTYFYIPSGPSA